jgi:hypothetical protein
MADCMYCEAPIASGEAAVADRTGAPAFHAECHLPFIRCGHARPGARPAGQAASSATPSGGRRTPDNGDKVAAAFLAQRRGYVAGRCYEELVAEELEKLLTDNAEETGK